MKIKIEIDETLAEDEAVIRCARLSDEVRAVQKAISEVTAVSQGLELYQGTTEYFIPLEEILFFETEGNLVMAHTREDIYQTRYKLYELEELLPGSFLRVSKSAILNTRCIYSLTRNLAASSVASFENCPKQVFVSRNYYKVLVEKLKEKRLGR